MKQYNYDYLFEAFSKHISNLDVSNPKFYITFSGVPASGKTTVARYLEKELKGLLLRADEVRETTKIIWPELNQKQIDKIIVEFTPTIQNRLLKYPNKLQIVDTNIDRYYQQVYDKVQELGYHLYIICINTPKDVLIERIKKREIKDGEKCKYLMSILEEKLKNHDEFINSQKDKINYYLTSCEENNLKLLVKDIKLKISSLN